MTRQRWTCPIQTCGWIYEEPTLAEQLRKVDFSVVQLAGLSFPDVIRRLADAASGQLSQDHEAVVANHANTHSVVEWAQEVARLNQENARLVEWIANNPQ